MTTKKEKPVKQPVKGTDKKQARKKRKYNRKPTMHQPVVGNPTDGKPDELSTKTFKVKEVSNVDLLKKHEEELMHEHVEPSVEKKGWFRRVLDFFFLK